MGEVFLRTSNFLGRKILQTLTSFALLPSTKFMQTSNSVYSRNTFESAFPQSLARKFSFRQKLKGTICEHFRNGFTSNHGGPIWKELMLKIALTSRPNGSLRGNPITLHNSFRESITCDVKLVEMIPHIESQKPKHEKAFISIRPHIHIAHIPRVIDF